MNRATGFTLIEITIVCALISLVIGLSIGTVFFLHTGHVRAQLDALCSTIIYSQQCARVLCVEQKIVLDIERHCYTYDNHSVALSDTLIFGSMSGVKGPPAYPHMPIYNPVTFKDNCITCAPTGIVQAGTVYLIDKKKNQLYAISCGVAQVSYVRMYRYNNGWERI